MIGYDDWKLQTPDERVWEIVPEPEIKRTPIAEAIKRELTDEKESEGYDYYTEEIYPTHQEVFLETKSGKRIRL